jgi:hypothetical protein
VAIKSGLKMRIRELLEGSNFNELEFIKKSNEGNEIDFELPDDLTFFMNNDDNVYRQHLHPVITKCIGTISKGGKTSPEIFKPAVESAYKMYVKHYPIRELPLSLDEKTCKEVCEKIHTEVCNHIHDGKYKD